MDIFVSFTSPHHRPGLGYPQPPSCLSKYWRLFSLHGLVSLVPYFPSVTSRRDYTTGLVLPQRTSTREKQHSRELSRERTHYISQNPLNTRGCGRARRPGEAFVGHISGIRRGDGIAVPRSRGDSGLPSQAARKFRTEQRAVAGAAGRRSPARGGRRELCASGLASQRRAARPSLGTQSRRPGGCGSPWFRGAERQAG